MDNIQLCYIDNEINKIDKMKQGDVIYKNGMELLVVLSYDHNEPCKGCFFYKNKACGSEKLIKCWDCKKEYIFTAIRKYNTTELCGIVKRYEETYKIILINEIVYMAYVGRSSCQLIQFIRHDNFQRPYFVGFGRQNSTTILHGILINAYICIHS